MSKPDHAYIFTFDIYVPCAEEPTRDSVATQSDLIGFEIAQALEAAGYQDAYCNNVESCRVVWHEDGGYDYE